MLLLPSPVLFFLFLQVLLCEARRNVLGGYRGGIGRVGRIGGFGRGGFGANFGQSHSPNGNSFTNRGRSPNGQFRQLSNHGFNGRDSRNWNNGRSDMRHPSDRRMREREQGQFEGGGRGFGGRMDYGDYIGTNIAGGAISAASGVVDAAASLLPVGGPDDLGAEDVPDAPVLEGEQGDLGTSQCVATFAYRAANGTPVYKCECPGGTSYQYNRCVG
ncbi:unnamed protein product [Cylicocyclus nassatus]|uniref:Uncharacterized protein n=1 Tax=Cylicocyclus nassatus TaxID=53992 RepID=A0AA36GZE3_CYLNA|nr:unnamed protein product [Cylicocyclus nassatus]